MSFLVPIMTLGILAAVVPVIIHLFNRSRYRVVRWGAMHLLDSVVRVNRRRIRIEQLILLAIRAAIPVVIALFMARPVITGWRVLPGNVKSSVALLVDNSYSMEAGGSEQSNFAIAKHETDRIVDSLERGSDATVVPMAGGGESFLERPTTQLKLLRKKVRDLGCGFGVADAAGSMVEGLGRFSRMGHADRELVVLSDFQRISWENELASERRRVAELLEEMEVRPHLTLFPTGREYRENISVESLTLSRLIVGVGQKVRVKATLRNHGDARYTGLRVHFRVDGRDREVSEVALGPREESQVIFSCVFDDAGSHYVEVGVDADPLTADNFLLAAIPVWDEIPVLLVSGEMSERPLEGETDYLRVALEPFSSGRLGISDLIRSRVVDSRELRPEDFRDLRVVVLANVEKLSDSVVKHLEDFVRTGGGLLVFPGRRCDLGWYNAVLAKREGVLPARIASIAGSQEDRAKQTTVVEEHFDHEALAMFNIPQNGTIAGTEVRMWCALTALSEEGFSEGGVSVLAKLATGDPFLVEKKYGESKVILCSTSCDAEWSRLPLRPVYLPLMQQLVTYLASTVYPPRNVEVGDHLITFLSPRMAGGKLTVHLPDGTRHKVDVVDKGARSVATFTATDRPGLYRVTGDGIETVHFVVNTTREESRIERLSDEELVKVAEELGAQIVTSSSEYEKARAERRHGREVWRYFFWFAVFLVFAELVIQQLFSRRKA